MFIAYGDAVGLGGFQSFTTSFTMFVLLAGKVFFNLCTKS